MRIERTVFLSGLALLLASNPTVAERASAEGPLVSVDPRIGTGGHGHTYPGATVPFGMVQVSPDTWNEGWDWCSGYHRSDTSIMGFSHTHLSGTGAADLLDVLLMPTLGPLKLEPGTREQPETGYRARFTHDEETATPGYYAVRLATGIRVELTATERVGLQRYTFPASDAAHVVLDLAHMIGSEGGSVLDSELRIVDDTTIEGWRRVSRWAKDRHVYFVARFSKPFADFGLLVGEESKPGLREARGTRLKAWVDYRTSAAETVLVRVALSPTGIEGARRNLETEAPRPDFDGARTAAEASWRKALSAIAIEGATPQQRRVSRRPSITPFWRRRSSTTSTAAIAGSTDGCTGPPVSTITARSRSGTLTAPLIRSTASSSGVGCAISCAA
jgi:predicted alpha-1,2-mannosidase